MKLNRYVTLQQRTIQICIRSNGAEACKNCYELIEINKTIYGVKAFLLYKGVLLYMKYEIRKRSIVTSERLHGVRGGCLQILKNSIGIRIRLFNEDTDETRNPVIT